MLPSALSLTSSNTSDLVPMLQRVRVTTYTVSNPQFQVAEFSSSLWLGVLVGEQ